MAGDARQRYEDGLAAARTMQPAAAARHLRAALRQLDRRSAAADGELIGKILLTLAWAEAEQGRLPAGLRLLDRAEPLLPLAQQGLLLGQRGLMLLRIGRMDEAVDALDRAAEQLRRSDPVELAGCLLNRGVTQLARGRLAAAGADFTAAARLADAAGLDLLAAKAIHDLGCVRHLRGDLPGALHTFDRAERSYARLAPGALPVLALDRARALLAAGLYREADGELDSATTAFAAQRLTEDLAEALLVRADAALLAGQPQTARTWADKARAGFRRRGNSSGAAIAALTAARAQLAAGDPSASLPARAARLGVHLRAHGLSEDARTADILAVRARLALGRPAHCPASAAPRPGDRLDTRLQWHLARAEEFGAAGRNGRQARQLRAGLAELHRQRGRLGCLDLQTAASAHGQELARAGLALALRHSSPLGVFEWSERVRAQALLLPAARPPDDPEAAAALEQLRHARAALQSAQLTGRSTTALRGRCARLEKVVREHAWFTAGAGRSAGTASFEQVVDELGSMAMVSYLSDGTVLAALVVVDGVATLVRLGALQPVEIAVRRLAADLDALAGRLLPERMTAAIGVVAHRDAAILTRLAVEPLSPLLGDRDLVVVPAGALVGTPWGSLPAARGRPVTVAPSASSWLAARGRRRDTAGGRSGTLLVAGPGLAHADREVRAIAALQDEPSVLVGTESTAAATLSGLDGVELAHLAAHGRQEPENPLFSWIELVDGPLMGYDLQQLSRPPVLVLLSACDLGLQDVRPGDEPLGIPAALLGTGACTIVASVSRVADEEAISVMVALHRELKAGRGPAAALSAATAGRLVGFINYGAD
ncbi:MAG: CHAT domain-containing protein [Mycobacteriales bacterium]